MNGLKDYNLREIKKEFLSRMSLQEFTTSQLKNEIERRDESEVQKYESGLLPSHRAFLTFCAEHFDLTGAQLTGPRRHHGLSNARQITLCVAADVFRLSGHQASSLLGRKNHTSLIHARKVLRQFPALAEDAENLKTKWKNRNR